MFLCFCWFWAILAQFWTPREMESDRVPQASEIYWKFIFTHPRSFWRGLSFFERVGIFVVSSRGGVFRIIGKLETYGTPQATGRATPQASLSRAAVRPAAPTRCGRWRRARASGLAGGGTAGWLSLNASAYRRRSRRCRKPPSLASSAPTSP